MATSSLSLTSNTEPTTAPARSAIPAALAGSVEIVDKGGGDLRDQRLETCVEAVFLGIKNAVAMNDPADVARLVRAQDVGRPGGLPRLPEQPLGGLECLDEARLIGIL